MKLRNRIVALLAVGMTLACAGLACIYFWHARPIGQGPAGPAVLREVFAAPRTTQPVFLVGLGDSVTAGFGARKGYGYFERLAANPPDEFKDMQGICLAKVFPNLRVTNLAVSGSTSTEHAERQLPRMPMAESNVFGIIVITTGGNDLIHNYGRTPPREAAMYGATWEEAQPWVSNFERRLESMLTNAISRFPGGCSVYLANIYDPTDSAGDIARTGLPLWKDGMKILSAYNEAIRRCAERHQNVHLVNLHDTFLGHGIHCTQFWAPHYDRRDPHYWYYVNLEDPNERGYDAIRRLFLIEIAKSSDSFKEPNVPR